MIDMADYVGAGSLSKELYSDKNSGSLWEKAKEYVRGCFDPEKARLYGTFQERTALNTTQFPKIQGSLLIRMGMVYPLISAALDHIGIPKEGMGEFLGVNFHTYLAGYLAYLTEIEAGLSKYPVELIGKSVKKMKKHLDEESEILQLGLNDYKPKIRQPATESEYDMSAVC